MDLDTITAFVMLVGFFGTLLILVQAEICYRRVTRYLELNAARDEDANAGDV